jgi:hypothetical protein
LFLKFFTALSLLTHQPGIKITSINNKRNNERKCLSLKIQFRPATLSKSDRTQTEREKGRKEREQKAAKDKDFRLID